MRTFGSLRLSSEGLLWVVEACEPHVAIRLKQIFPRIEKASKPPWLFRNEPQACADLDWFTDRYPLAIDAADRKKLEAGRRRYEAELAEIERIRMPDYVPPALVGLQPGAAIRHYQAQAIEVLARSKGMLLGDDVGLGKTYTAAGACLKPGALPAVVVCFAHLQQQWRDVLRSFTTLRVHAIAGTRPYSLPEVDVYVFRYTQILGWSDVFETMKPGLVVFDEVQDLRGGTKTGKGTAARRLSDAARMRLGLSATPIYNYGTEAWEVFQFLRPDVLGDRIDFWREWCGNGMGVADPAALGTYLREQSAFIRRTKRDVGQEMPAVNKIVDLVDHDVDAVRSIEDRARDLAIKATTGEFTERGQAARELDMMVRHQTGVAKAGYVADFVRILVEGGEPVLLLGWHRDVYDVWLERLADLKPVMYTGTETPAGKARAAQTFLSGDSDLMIMSLRSGAGLDGLQHRCSTIVFGELDWSPGVHEQATGRLFREGQRSPVTAIYLVTDDGSDPPMVEMLGLKAAQASKIVDPTLGPQAVHSDYSRVRTLVDRYLAKRKRGINLEAVA